MNHIFPTSDPHVFRVRSFTNPHISYVVRIPRLAQLWLDEATCSCPEHKCRHRVCKHILAVVVHLCEQAPLRIHLGGGRYYIREPHEIVFWSEDRHSWAHISVPKVLAMRVKEVLQPAPPRQAVIEGLRTQLLNERGTSHAFTTLLDKLYQGNSDVTAHPVCSQDASTPVEACSAGA